MVDLDDAKGVLALLGGVLRPDREMLPLFSRKLPTFTKLALRGRCRLDAILCCSFIVLV